MLNNIQNNTSNEIAQNAADLIAASKTQSLEAIGKNDSSKYDDYNKYFIDQSDISNTALEKYQKEEDIKTFSKLLLQTDEKEAVSRVLDEVFNQKYEIENDEFLNNLLTNKDFLNDIYK